MGGHGVGGCTDGGGLGRLHIRRRLLLLVVPNILLGLLRIEESTESWVRVLGVVVLLLAFYNFVMALSGANTNGADRTDTYLPTVSALHAVTR